MRAENDEREARRRTFVTSEASSYPDTSRLGRVWSSVGLARSLRFLQSTSVTQ